MKHLATILLFPLLIGLCQASEPAAKIAAPEKALVGFPVLLQTDGSSGKTMKWITFPADPNTVFLSVVTEEGQRVGLFVSPTPGTFHFALATTSDDKIAVAKHTLLVEGPQPNPQPDPVPPVPVGRLWTVIVEESSQLTPAQGRIVASKSVAEYLQSKGHHQAWIIDRDVLDENDRQPPSLAEYVARAKSLPYWFLVSESGTVLHESRLPETESALLEILKKHGG